MRRIAKAFLHLACDLCGAERSRIRILAGGNERAVCLLDERFSRSAETRLAPAGRQLELLEPGPAEGTGFESARGRAPCVFGEASIDRGFAGSSANRGEWSLRRNAGGLDFELDLSLDDGGAPFANERMVRAASLIDLFESVLEGRGFTAGPPLRPAPRLVEFDPPFVGRSAAMAELRRDIRSVAPSGLSVLIEGESGTGKEVVAKNLHRLSPRRARPLVVTSALEAPHSLLQSELFGHVEGAFTGASRDRIGLIESANGGTFFLDEIGELPLALQAALLRVLQEREVRRIGESRRRRVDARFVFATNRDLEELVRKGRFRRDLYFRIAVMRLRVPPLRARREDVVPLAAHFLGCCAAQAGVETPALAASAVRRLVEYDWPGNVRELKNEMERAFALHGAERAIGSAALSPHLDGSRGEAVTAGAAGTTIPETVERLERGMIRDALDRAGGNRTRAAEALGITRQGLLKKLKRYAMLP
jgi:DNA-binding NtrC family response regulator